jgi:hypothetical protein
MIFDQIMTSEFNNTIKKQKAWPASLSEKGRE